jgi:flavoprotein
MCDKPRVVSDVFNSRGCMNCTQADITNVNRLELSYCRGCVEMPVYIPTDQIKQYIRKKYYGTDGD